MPAEEPSETPSWSATERTEMHDFSSGQSFHSGFPLKFLKNSVQNGSDPFGDRKGLKPKKPDAIECFFASIPLRDTLLSRNERIQNLVRAISCRFDSGPGHHQAKILPARLGFFYLQRNSPNLINHHCWGLENHSAASMIRIPS